MMNKIYNQDALKNAFYTFSSDNGRNSFNSEEKKKKRENCIVEEEV
jgi:hypothetical protein